MIPRTFASLMQENQSASSKDRINRLLSEVNELSETEKLLLYLKLPTGIQREIRAAESVPRVEITEASNWIKTHLQPHQETCLQKNEVYEDYLNYCDKQGLRPVGREDLGKLMRTNYPTVTGRRLGTRGQTKHCYGGLTKNVDLQCKPLIEDNVETGEKQTLTQDLENGIVQRRELVMASSAVICEWAEKLLKHDSFKNINQVAQHLVRNSYVNCNSLAAYTVMSQVVHTKDENGLATNTEKSSGGITRQNSSGAPRNAKHQLQLKLQEKERLKEQKKRLEEQRSANTAAVSNGDDSNVISCDGLSNEASLSSENNSNQGNGTNARTPDSKPVTKQPKTLLPKTVIPVTTSSKAEITQTTASSNGVSKEESMTTEPPPTVNPLLILSADPASGAQQLAGMFLLSPLNQTQQLVVPIQTAQTLSKSPISASDVGKSKVNKPEESRSAESDRNTHTNGGMPELSQSNALTNGSSGVSFNLSNQAVSVDDLGKAGTGEGSADPSEVEGTSVFHRSQSLPTGLVNSSGVINNKTIGSESAESSVASSVCSSAGPGGHSATGSTQFRFSPDSVKDVFNKLIKKEDNVFNTSSTSGGAGQHNFSAAISSLAESKTLSIKPRNMELPLKESVNGNSKSVDSSPLQSPKLTPRGLGNRRGPSRTVSSLLKEQRDTREESAAEVGGKNKYVNDNRPVAQILKEIREKKKIDGHQSGKAMQKLSFVEEKASKGSEQSFQSLNEKIAREAMFMRKVLEQNTLAARYTGRGDNGVESPRNQSPVSNVKTWTKNPSLKNGGDAGKVKLKDHQLALRNLLNERRSAVKTVKEPQSETNTEKSSACSSRKENSFLMKSLAATDPGGSNTGDKTSQKTVSASMNPTLAYLLADNNCNNIKDPKMVTSLLQKLMNPQDSNNSLQFSRNQAAVQSNGSKHETSWTETNMSLSAANVHVGNGNGDNGTIGRNSSISGAFNMNVVSNGNKTRLESVPPQNRNFMPIQSVAEANIVSPIKPQAMAASDTQSQLTNSSGTFNNIKLKDLLSGTLSENSSRDSSDVCQGNFEWMPRENSSFVPYNQNCSNQLEQHTGSTSASNESLDMSGQSHLNMCSQQQVGVFQQANPFQTEMPNVVNTFSGNNSNDGFASMDGVRPPSKRLLGDADFPLSKRSRHKSDQTSIRKRRNNMYGASQNRTFLQSLLPANRQLQPGIAQNRTPSHDMTPLQPLIPQNRTPSHESLTPMPSPSSSQGGGFNQCPPESPFSPEVHAILSNTTNDFSDMMDSNTFRSMSVPVQNFMENDGFGDFGVGMMGSSNFIQGSNSAVLLSDNSSQLIGQQQQMNNSSQYVNMSQTFNNENSYQQQQPQQQQHISSIANNQNMASINARMKQNLESRIVSGFKDTAQQNLRGDHMISGASIKPSQNVGNQLRQALKSVMVPDPSNNYSGNNLQFGGHQMQSNEGHFSVPLATPPTSHPSTPVDFHPAAGDFQANNPCHYDNNIGVAHNTGNSMLMSSDAQSAVSMAMRPMVRQPMDNLAQGVCDNMAPDSLLLNMGEGIESGVDNGQLFLSV